MAAHDRVPRRAPLLALALAILAWTSSPVFAQQDEDAPPPPPIEEGATVSPDGTSVAYVSSAGGPTTIWIARRDGRAARPLVAWGGSTQHNPDWGTDGRTLVFDSNRESATFQIWRFRIADGVGQQLTTSGNNTHPRYSPDGARIAFVSDRSGLRELWVMNADGTGQISLTPRRSARQAAWSPAGDSLVFTRCHVSLGADLSNGVCNLFVLSVTTGQETQLTHGAALDWSPDWDVLGIAFSSNRSGRLSLWYVNHAGDSMQPITAATMGLDIMPRWERQAHRVVFTRVGATFETWITDLSGVAQPLRFVQGPPTGIPGDVDGDAKVTCADIALVRLVFGRLSAQAGFDSRADVVTDNRIDIRDLSYVSQRLPANAVCR